MTKQYLFPSNKNVSLFMDSFGGFGVMKKILIVVLAVFLSSCAAPHLSLGNKALDEGRLSAAEEHYTQAIREGDNPGASWNNLSIVYQKQGRQKASIEALKMGARYGNSYAQQNLVREGLPVPPADLAERSSSSGSDSAAALLFIANSLSKPKHESRSPVFCDSKISGNKVRTECF